MALKYTLTATTPVTISGIEISGSTYLMELDFKTQLDLDLLYSEIDNGNIKLYNEGVEVINSKGIISQYARQINQRNQLDIDLANDLKVRDKVKEFRNEGVQYVSEAVKYTERRRQGQTILEKEMAILLVERANGTITDAELERLDALATPALLEANAGQLQTALGSLMRIQAEYSAENQLVKDYIDKYVNILTVAVSQNYG